MTEKIIKMLYKTEVGGSVMEDLRNFKDENDKSTKITPKRILEELEYMLYKVEMDGWEEHLSNPQQIISLKSLIKKVKKIVKQ